MTENRDPCAALDNTHYVCPFRTPKAVQFPGPHSHGNICPNAREPECPLREGWLADVTVLGTAFGELVQATLSPIMARVYEMLVELQKLLDKMGQEAAE